MNQQTGEIIGISGNMITVRFEGSIAQNEVGYAISGEERLKSEVIRIQDDLAKHELRTAEQETPQPSEPTRRPQPLEGETCPHCGEGILVWLAAIPRPPRGPPRLILAPRPDVVRF